MKKKWLAGIGIGVGGVMLMAGGLSASAGVTGYETYKEAVKHTSTITSIAGKASFHVTDNGATIFDTSASFKGDKANRAGSASVQMTNGKESKTLQVYHQEGKTVLKKGDSEVYQVHKDADYDSKNTSGHDSYPDAGKHAELAEHVIDTLVGQLRNEVTLTESGDGVKNVALHLNSSQIPAPVQAIGSLLISAASEHGEEQMNADPAHGLDIELPKLVDDVHIDAINLDAAIDSENYVDSQTAEIQISGTDAAGKKHEVKVHLALDFTQREQVVPDQVDLTGKQIEMMKTEESTEHGHGW